MLPVLHPRPRTLVVPGLLLAAAIAGALGSQAATHPTGAASAAPAAVSLTALDVVTTKAAAAVAPAVVKITSSSGTGSGVIIDTRGYVVTNYHVLAGSSGDAQASSYTVTLSTGTSRPATIAGTDSADDLAVLKISAPGLRALPLANSDAVRVGQFVLAVGNPLGEAQSMTLGIVSTLGRNIVENGPAAVIFHMIQTSAPINPGNSGGALVDLQGRLVGVPTLAASDPRLGTAAQGIGFAIPSNRVAVITGQIIRSGKVTHSQLPYLGVAGLQVVSPQLAARYGLSVESGILISEVVAGGPAAKDLLCQGAINQ